jgi:hypothetical protein
LLERSPVEHIQDLLYHLLVMVVVLPVDHHTYFRRFA